MKAFSGWAGKGSELGALLYDLDQTLRGAEWRVAYYERGGLASRKRRRMPSLPSIAVHLGLERSRPGCVKCGYQPPVQSWSEAAGWLIRAHVIDRGIGGLDYAANLRPLCTPCHRRQPIFRPGDEDDALRWFGSAP